MWITYIQECISPPKTMQSISLFQTPDGRQSDPNSAFFPRNALKISLILLLPKIDLASNFWIWLNTLKLIVSSIQRLSIIFFFTMIILWSKIIKKKLCFAFETFNHSSQYSFWPAQKFFKSKGSWYLKRLTRLTKNYLLKIFCNIIYIYL